MVAFDRNLYNQADLFDASPGDGGDELPLRGLALERLRDTFGSVGPPSEVAIS